MITLYFPLTSMNIFFVFVCGDKTELCLCVFLCFYFVLSLARPHLHNKKPRCPLPKKIITLETTLGISKIFLNKQRERKSPDTSVQATVQSQAKGRQNAKQIMNKSEDVLRDIKNSKTDRK